MQTLLGGDQNRARHLWRKVRGRNKVDVVTATRLQLQHHLGQALVRDFVLDLVSMLLRNLIVLAVDTAQVAVTKKDIARAARAGERRLFAEMGRVGRNNRQASRIARRDFIIQTIVQTVAGTHRAAFQQSFQRFDAMAQLARLQQAKISGIAVFHLFIHGGVRTPTSRGSDRIVGQAERKIPSLPLGVLTHTHSSLFFLKCT